MSILWLDDTDCQNVSVTGGKVANLSRLASRYPVPGGFCLTTAAFREWARHSDGTDGFPVDLRRQLDEAYDELTRRNGNEAPCVAVRSSAIDEDGQFASFAGVYETYLNLTGADAVAEAVLRCWRSIEGERVAEYRARHGLSLEDVEMAVLVQHLVSADSSGVIFSANPVTHDRDQVVINASWGLGESIVGGTVTPDTFVVDKKTLSPVESIIADKARMTVRVAGGTNEVPVPRFMRTKPTLTNEQLREMAELAISLEEAMGWPVDLECAYGADGLYLLQCRLITTLPETTIESENDDV